MWMWTNDVYPVDFHCSGLPHKIKKYWIVKWFARPWKSIEFGQNGHKVLKKYGNSKFSDLFIQILFFTTDDNFADAFALCCINKISEKWR